MLVAYHNQPVEVDVIDYTRSATTYQQVACNEKFAIYHHPDGSSTVRMPLSLDAYAAHADGTKAERLEHVKRSDILIA
ncbi:hypothetical protein F1C16_07985 [Hymenobacter sp. NBH84]|uniref:hypothetical protein n=1 Tax=Hymenobacter sp. NBH84 TaxID=2596915 RepID=UPI0016259A51|nr:hypothetical protein [Hymenobacter sp. NBH84]QNE39495.1 hypothetical protein F1C16_07985 [Hymenobacter sp. NBH84]